MKSTGIQATTSCVVAPTSCRKAVAKELAVELVAETAAVELEVEMAAVAVEAMAAETVQLAFQP